MNSTIKDGIYTRVDVLPGAWTRGKCPLGERHTIYTDELGEVPEGAQSVRIENGKPVEFK